LDLSRWRQCLVTGGAGKVVSVPPGTADAWAIEGHYEAPAALLTMAPVGLGLNVQLNDLRTKALSRLIAMTIVSVLLATVTLLALVRSFASYAWGVRRTHHQQHALYASNAGPHDAWPASCRCPVSDTLNACKGERANQRDRYLYTRSGAVGRAGARAYNT
jgi:hypothetical protein